MVFHGDDEQLPTFTHFFDSISQHHVEMIIYYFWIWIFHINLPITLLSEPSKSDL